VESLSAATPVVAAPLAARSAVLGGGVVVPACGAAFGEDPAELGIGGPADAGPPIPL